MSVTCWYVAHCPAESCEDTCTCNFISGKSAQEVKEYLRLHLEDSCFHSFTKNEIKEFVEKAQIDFYQYDPEATAKRKREDGEPQRSERDGGARSVREVGLRARSAKRARGSTVDDMDLKTRLQEAAQQCSTITDALYDAAKSAASLEWNLRYLANSFRMD